jgi:hypothetical protein
MRNEIPTPPLIPWRFFETHCFDIGFFMWKYSAKLMRRRRELSVSGLCMIAAM